MDPYYQYFGDGMENYYFQPQTQCYQLGYQSYLPMEQRNRYEEVQEKFTESVWKCNEVMHQMREHQEQQFARIQNIQSQLDQIASSINQLQTQTPVKRWIMELLSGLTLHLFLPKNFLV